MGRWINILIIGLLVAGVSLLLYPTVSDYINSKQASAVISDYHENYVNTKEEKRKEMLSDAEKYNELLKGSSKSLFEPSQVIGYNKLLDPMGSGVMGYIDIDKIGVELPIYHGVDKGVLQIGAGHLEGSSLPVGGEGTHCVLSGHRGLPSAKLFTDLDRMEIGDKFTLTVLDRVMTYEVDQIKTVLPQEVSDLTIEEGRDYCTLVTCTPYGINTHRLLVRGVRVDQGAAKTPGIFVSNEAFKVNSAIVATVMAVPAFIAVVIVTIIIERRRTGHGKEK